MQEGLADVWKENLLEGLKLGEVEFKLAREFLLEKKLVKEMRSQLKWLNSKRQNREKEQWKSSFKNLEEQ